MVGARLPPEVRPTHYSLELAIDPNARRFTGRARIDVELASVQRRIQMHAEDLEIVTARIESADGVRNAEVVVDGPGRISLLAPEGVSGALTLELDYGAPLIEGSVGLIAVQSPSAAVISQLEPAGARRVFPGFDEPGFKAPFDITLEVPTGYMAFSNGPMVSSQRRGDRDVVRFATTPPLPTYSLAFAVGSFDVLDSPIGALPHRLVTSRGQLDQARYAAEQAPQVLGALTRYLGSDYPYAKLDQMAVAGFPAGAMENAGLVLYRDDVLLLSPNAGVEKQTRLRTTMAHELSHMWFGNQVTMRWWDDLWLNEALATWMGEKVMFEIAPELDSPLWAVTSMLGVMARDALVSAHPIQHSIEDAADIENAFDSMTYDKGFAVLRMLEGWIGEHDFRAGIRAYLRRHAGGNATLGDLERALEQASSKPVAKVLRPFVTQPGTPLLSLRLSCAESRVTAHYDIRRYRANPDDAPTAGTWAIPVCLRLFAASQEQTTCLVLDGAAGEAQIDADFCPEFMHPNAGETGYYHWHVGAPELVALATQQRGRLSLAERIGLPEHSAALWEAGAIDTTTFLDVLRGSSLEQHRLVLEDLIAELELIRRAWPATASRQSLARFAGELLGPHLRRIGARSRPTDPAGYELVRRSLVQTAFQLRGDPAILDAARTLTRRFLVDPGAVPEGDAETLLPIAASQGDPALHAGLQRLLAANPPPTRRSLIITALGSFGDAELLVRGYDLWLGGDMPASAFWVLSQPAQRDPVRYQTLWRWYVRHAEAVAKRLGASSRWLPFLGTPQCTAEGIAEARQHFRADAHLDRSGLDNIDAALEGAGRCSKLRERHGASLVAALGPERRQRTLAQRF